jgi:crotonobetainyl-CoA:carnitine CoA-transferase CaiB-like acyl-CoA transferase
MTLNLKKPAALEVLRRLVTSADVIVENWRPDVKKRLGVDYESLRAINPRIHPASISGFGQDGPYAGRPGFDQVIQGMGGLMSLTGTPESGPMRAGIAVADSSINEGEVPQPAGNDHPTSAPMGLFHASDGAFNLGGRGGRPAAYGWFATRTVAHWVDLLNDAGVPSGPVYTVPQLLDDPQIRHLGVVEETRTTDGTPIRVISQPVRLSRTPAGVVAAAPAIGEQTDEVLREVGYDDAQIARLRADDIV